MILFAAGLCSSGAPGSSERRGRLDGGGPSGDPDVSSPPSSSLAPSLDKILACLFAFAFLFSAIGGCRYPWETPLMSCSRAFSKMRIGTSSLSRVRQWHKRLKTLSLVSFEGSNILKSLGMVSTFRNSVGALARSSQGTRAYLFFVIFAGVDQNSIISKKN
jgi:hypothetical protein